jgi:GNAT superfamily N-acetyltransferase
MDFIIRPAKGGELKSIQAILKRSSNWKIHMAGAFFYILTIPNKKDSERPRWIIGTVGISDSNRICYLAVEPKYRRKGYGKALMMYIVKEYPISYLRVKLSNWKAILLYLKCGFRPAGIFKNLSLIMRYGHPPRITRKKMKQKRQRETKILLDERPLSLKNWLERKNGKIVFKGERLVIQSYTDDIVEVFSKKTFTGEFTYERKDFTDVFMRLESLQKFWKIPRGILDLAKQELPQDPQWKYWMVSGKKWTTRFSNLYYKKLGIKEIPAISRGLGSLWHITAPIKYKFILTDVVDWRAGEFGDTDSCWFDNKIHIRNGLFNSGHGYAFKFYRSSMKYGRCWVYAYKDRMYLFNARGFDINTIGEIITHKTHFEYKKIDAKDGNNECSYIENAIVIAPSVSDLPNSHTLKWSV